MEDGWYFAKIKDDKIVVAKPQGPPPHSPSGNIALEQAVIWANGLAHAVRKEPKEVVAAAVAFQAFLDGPEPDEA